MATKVLHWNKVSPVIDSLYQRINEGYYSSNNLSVNSLQEDNNNTNELAGNKKITNFADIEPETLSYMKAKGWTEDLWNNLSDREKEQAMIS